jgi:hypothetical protein
MKTLSVARSDADRFLSEVEECLRLAELALSPFDRRAWLELAEDWLKLARAATEQVFPLK